jgi:hypothetical protein
VKIHLSGRAMGAGKRRPYYGEMSVLGDAILKAQKERRNAARYIVLATPPAEKKRVKALAQMAPPTPEEVARLVEQFQRAWYITKCPTRAAAPINNDEGFGE